MILNQYILARNKYKPDEVEILFIAESPPASGSYFYFPETTGKDSLFNSTMKALDLYPENKVMKKRALVSKLTWAHTPEQ